MTTDTIEFVCTGCSLLCDDVQVRGNENPEFENLCTRGLAYCRNWHRQTQSGAGPTVGGQSASLDRAIEAAVETLVPARFPLVCGLADQSTETQMAAIRLAQTVDAAIDWTSSFSPLAWHHAMQVTGQVTCSLGELQELADHVIVWAADPLTTHPRLLERYPGRITIIDDRETATSRSTGQFLNWSRPNQQAAIRFLREQLAGPDPDPALLPDQHRLEMQEFAGQLQASRYPVFVVDEQFASRLGNVGVTGMAQLVRSMNEVNRCRLLQLVTECNAVGAAETATAMTAAPFGVLFRGGRPMFRGRSMTTQAMLENGTADLVILVAHFDDNHPISRQVLESGIPAIRIGPSGGAGEITIPARRWGIDAGGSGCRTDAVPLAGPAIVASQQVDAGQVLDQIREAWLQHSAAGRSGP